MFEEEESGIESGKRELYTERRISIIFLSFSSKKVDRKGWIDSYLKRKFGVEYLL